MSSRTVIRHPPPIGRPASRRRAGERGVLLVALMVGITVMMVLLTASAQSWMAVMKREREEELMFRGNQYIRALRKYQTEHGGQFPMKLEDLMEEGPQGHRYLRQAFPDPFAKDGKWNLLYLGPDGKSYWNPHAPMPGGSVPGLGGVGEAGIGESGRGPAGRGSRSFNALPGQGAGQMSGQTLGQVPGQIPGQIPGQAGGFPGLPGGSPDAARVAAPGGGGAFNSHFASGNINTPIVGVVSQATDQAFGEFYGKQYYNEWEFHVFLLDIPKVQGSPQGLNINPSGQIGPGHGIGFGGENNPDKARQRGGGNLGPGAPRGQNAPGGGPQQRGGGGKNPGGG